VRVPNAGDDSAAGGVFAYSRSIANKKDVFFLDVSCSFVDGNWSCLAFDDFSVEFFAKEFKGACHVFFAGNSNACLVVVFRDCPSKKSGCEVAKEGEKPRGVKVARDCCLGAYIIASVFDKSCSSANGREWPVCSDEQVIRQFVFRSCMCEYCFSVVQSGEFVAGVILCSCFNGEFGKVRVKCFSADGKFVQGDFKFFS